MTHKEEIKYLKILGARLKQIRKEKGLTQGECGVDERTIRRIEGNAESFNPSFLTLVEIANGIGVEVSDLLDFSKENSK